MTVEEARELRATIAEALAPIHAACRGTIPHAEATARVRDVLNRLDVALLGVIDTAAVARLAGTPYTCPVCQGRGTVRGDFYFFAPSGHLLQPITCRTCQGAGLVWRG